MKDVKGGCEGVGDDERKCMERNRMGWGKRISRGGSDRER